MMKTTFLIVYSILLISFSFQVFGLSPNSSTNNEINFPFNLISNNAYEEAKQILFYLNDSKKYLIEDLQQKTEKNKVIEFSLPDFLKIGNVKGLLKFKDNFPGAFIIIGETPYLSFDKNPVFMTGLKLFPEFQNDNKQMIESFLKVIGVEFRINKDKSIILIEKSDDIQKIEAFYNEFLPFLEWLKNDNDSIGSGFQPILSKLIQFFSNEVDGIEYLSLLWSIITEYTRIYLDENQLFPEDISNANGFDFPDPDKTSPYEKLQKLFSFFCVASSGNKTEKLEDLNWALFKTPTFMLFRFNSLLNDWLRRTNDIKLRITNGSEFYQNYLIELYICALHPELTKVYEEFKTPNLISFLNELRNATELSRVMEKDDDKRDLLFHYADNCIISFIIYYQYLTRLTIHMDYNAQSNMLTHLSNEIKKMYNIIRKMRESEKLSDDRIRKMIERALKNPNSANDSSIMTSISNMEKLLIENNEDFENQFGIAEHLLLGMEQTLSFFRIGVNKVNNYSLSNDTSYPNLFYYARMMAPDAVLNKDGKYKFVEIYEKVKDRLQKSFEYIIKNGSDSESDFNLLMQCNERLFNILYFWDFSIPEKTYNSHVKFLKETIEAKNTDSTFAALELGYHFLIMSKRFPNEKNIYLREAKHSFKKCFELIPSIIKTRLKESAFDDSNYSNYMIEDNIPTYIQEVNRLNSFMNIILFTKSENMNVPTSFIHKDGEIVTFENERKLLLEILDEELSNTIRDPIFITCIVKYLIPLIEAEKMDVTKFIEDVFINRLFKYKLSDLSINTLLKSMFIEDNIFSLIYADYILNYLEKNPKIIYPKTRALCQNYIRSEKTHNFRVLFLYTKRMLLENRFTEAFSSLEMGIANRFQSDEYEKILAINNFEDIIVALLSAEIKAFITGKIDLKNEIIKISQTYDWYNTDNSFFKNFKKNVTNILKIAKNKKDNSKLNIEISKYLIDSNAHFIFAIEFLIDDLNAFSISPVTKTPKDLTELITFWTDAYKINFSKIQAAKEILFVLEKKGNLNGNNNIEKYKQQMEDIEKKFLILKFLNKLSIAYQQEDFLKAKHYMEKLKDIFGITLNVNKQQNKNQKNGKKGKNGKKNKIKVKQSSIGSEVKLFQSFPGVVRNQIQIFFMQIEQKANKLEKENEELLEYFSELLTKLYMREQDDDFQPFSSIEVDITKIEMLAKDKPYILSSNTFSPESEIYEWAEFLDGNVDNILNLLRKIKIEEDSFTANGMKALDLLLSSEVNQTANMQILIKSLSELQKTDEKAFENILQAISKKMSKKYLDYLKEIKSLSEHITEDNIADHKTLSQNQYLSMMRIHYVASKILNYEKEQYINIDFLKLPKPLIEIANIESKINVVKNLHILKLLRLKLHAQNEADEIRKAEQENSFLGENDKIEYSRIPFIYSEISDKIRLDISDLPTFLPGAPNNRKLKKAQRIFKPGDRLIFMSKEDVKDRSKIRPIFEIRAIVSDNNDDGYFILSLVNRNSFPKEMKVENIIIRNVPDPQKDKKPFFIIKKTSDLRNRMRIMDKIVESLCSAFSKTYELENEFQSKIEIDKNSEVINSILGLIPLSEKWNLMKDDTDDIYVPDSMNIDQTFIYKNIFAGSKSNNKVTKVHFIEAPGGTGKTFFLLEMLQPILNQSQNALVTAPTHRAVDNVMLDMTKRKISKPFSRIGSTDASSKMIPTVKKLWESREDSLRKELLQKQNGVILGTSTGFDGDAVLNSIYREADEQDISPTQRDYIFYDEAGMDSIDTAIYLAYRLAKPETKIIFLGDNLQLRPFGIGSEEINDLRHILGDKLIRNFEGVNLDKTLFDEWSLSILCSSPLELFHGVFGHYSYYLTENYRSVEGIVKLLNKIAYSEYAKPMVSKVNTTIPLSDQVLHLKNTNYKITFEEELMTDKDGHPLPGQYINKGEIFSILKQMEKDFNSIKDLKGYETTFISPYKAQNNLFTISLWAFALKGELEAFLKDSEKLSSIDKEFLKTIFQEVNQLIEFSGNSSIKFDVLLKDNIYKPEVVKILNELERNLPSFIPKLNRDLTIERIMDFHLLDLNNPDITTIQQVQGRENRAVYFSTVRCNKYGNLGFLFGKTGPGMIVTAMGRARELLRVSGDENTWRAALSKRPGNGFDEARLFEGLKAVKMMIGFFDFSKEINRNNSFTTNIPYPSKNQEMLKAA